MPTMVAFKDRLLEAIALSGKTADDLAAHLKFTGNGMKKALRGGDKGTSAMTAENSSKTARFLNVDPDWLATGDGDPHSERVWPFGDAIAPAEFFALDPKTVQAAIDILQAEIRRQSGKDHGKASASIIKKDEISAQTLADRFRQAEDLAPYHPTEETNAERDFGKKRGKKDAV